MKYHFRAVEEAKIYKKSKRELVEILGVMDKTKEFLEHNVGSLHKYCEVILGLADWECAQIIQVIRKSEKMPLLKEAVSQGVITVEKASKICGAITPDTQELWIEVAKTSTSREIEKEVRRVKPEALLRERITPKTHEKSELRINITHELEEKLRRAREVLRTKSFEETLDKALEIALKHKDPVKKAERVLKKQHRTCDVPPKPSRYIPASVLHEVHLRDKGHCQEKGCGSRVFTEIHHIIHRSKGGKDTLNNLVTLCSMHHNMRHHFHRQFYKNPLNPSPRK